VRWENLFADLEAQLAEADAGTEAGEVAERTRVEQGRWTLADRLRAVPGASLRVVLTDGTRLGGRCVEAAPEWVVLAVEPTGRVLVPIAALATVEGLTRTVAPPAGTVERRLGLRHALRVLARERVPVRVHTAGTVVEGTIDRVAADHLDVAEHPGGEARRAGAVRAVVTVPLTAVLAVRSA
jgi:uncharacterized protein YqgV (UPF0045/DUF77 family)